MKKFWLVFILLALALGGGAYFYLQSIMQKSAINEIRPGSPLNMTLRVSPLPTLSPTPRTSTRPLLSPTPSSHTQFQGPPARDY